MKKLALAATVLAVLAGLTACQKNVTMWSPCQPAADGNPTGTDGTYVLACRNGTWEPIMTVNEWLAISSGKRVTIAPLPVRPTPPATPTPAPSTTTTTSTTSTTVLSTIQTIDLGDISATVGNQFGDLASVSVDVTFGDGRDGTIGLSVADTDQASDGGYDWLARASSVNGIGFLRFEVCQYPILSFRSRATIEGTTYRMDFDGEALGSVGVVDLDGPWDQQLGDLPTVYAESITVDWGGVSCTVLEF